MRWALAAIVVVVAAVYWQPVDAQLEHVDQHTSESDCPFPYSKHTHADVFAGTLPYLFGGDREPCNSCRAGEHAEFCRFQRPDVDV